MSSFVASLATITASLIIPFFDLDAALIVAEVTPLEEIEFIREIPNLQQVELIDSAYDVEEILGIESDAKNTEEIESLDMVEVDAKSKSSDMSVFPKKILSLTSSIVVTVLGTMLAKVRNVQKVKNN